MSAHAALPSSGVPSDATSDASTVVPPPVPVAAPLARGFRRWALACALVATSACGGGGDDGPAAAPPPALTPAPPSTPPGGEAPPAPPPAASFPAVPREASCDIPNFVQAVMDATNAARATARMCGETTFAAAPPLVWNTRLFDASAAHSADMATHNYFSHTGRDGSTFSQRIERAGYTWSRAGENIAAGYPDVARVMRGWIDSPGHCANLMRASYTEIGVACVRNPQSTYGTYWTMELGAPR